MLALAPQLVVGNLRLTADGVYAEYLLSGVPFIFLSEEWQNTAAADHAELWRTLPSGSSVSGLTVPVPTRELARRMLHAHPALRTDPGDPCAVAWVRHCRMWQHAVDAHRPRRRIYWLSIPLDDGRRRAFDIVAGRDRDTDAALADYRQRAAELVAALPAAFFPKPVSAEQIWWHWNYTASRGVWQQPLPARHHDPHAGCRARRSPRCTSIRPPRTLRGRRWRAARTDTEVFVRAYRNADDGVPDSYQALVPLDSFPDTGIAWPRATIFKVLDDLTGSDTTLDWTIHTTFTPTDTAVSVAQNVITNIRDQYRQRGRHADSDDELIRKLASGKELASELKRGSAERGVNPAIVIAAAGADADTVNAAVAMVMRVYRRQNIGARRWRGSQSTLWRAFNPGSERGAALGEFRNPTTTERFAKFVPLLSHSLGNRTGVPLGMNLTSPGIRDVVLLDLLGAPDRENPANLVICGSPGRGKSHIGKLLIRAWLALGAGVHIFDPGEPREHQRALADVEDLVVIDLADPGICIDPLRIFPYAAAAEHAVDHLLPLLGYAAMSRQAARLRTHLAAETRDTNGIGSLGGLISYLRNLARRPRPRRRRLTRRARGAAHRSPPARCVRRVAAGCRPQRHGRGGVEHRGARAAHRR